MIALVLTSNQPT